MGKVFSCFIAVLAFSVWAQAQSDVRTVSHVDLDRYVGKWYEIAAIPQSFEKDCAGGTTAEYSQASDGMIKVINSCNKKSGGRSVTEGRAKIEDTSSNAKLAVTFVKLGKKWVFFFSGKYWILDVDPNYRYAVVGHPNLQYAWVLSRDPVMPATDLATATSVLEKQGYDTCRVLTTPQPGGLTSKTALCEIAKGN